MYHQKLAENSSFSILKVMSQIFNVLSIRPDGSSHTLSFHLRRTFVTFHHENISFQTWISFLYMLHSSSFVCDFLSCRNLDFYRRKHIAPVIFSWNNFTFANKISMQWVHPGANYVYLINKVGRGKSFSDIVQVFLKSGPLYEERKLSFKTLVKVLNACHLPARLATWSLGRSKNATAFRKKRETHH